MSYLLSPFTDFVLQLLGIGPFWILYLGTVLALLGLVLYFTDKTELLGIVAGMLKTFTDKQGPVTVTISPSILRRIGLVILVTGIILGAAGTDATAATPSIYNYLGYGGPSLYHCQDPAVCWQPGGNITSCSTPAPSPCLTQVQHGSVDCTIGTITQNCIVGAITFPRAYSSVPTYNETLFYGSSGKVPVFSTTAIIGTTSFVTYNRLIFQAVNSTTWTNMTSHDNPTELYGKTNQELQSQVPTGSTVVQAEICVDVVQASQNSTATLGVQFGTTDLSDGNGKLLANVGTAGLQCTSPFGNTNLTIGSTLTFKVVGRDGTSNFFCTPTCATNPVCSQNNVAAIGTNVDCPQFGTIELLYWYTTTINVSGPNPCVAYNLSLTATTIKPAVRCNLVPSVAVTFHLSWTVGILA